MPVSMSLRRNHTYFTQMSVELCFGQCRVTIEQQTKVILFPARRTLGQRHSHQQLLLTDNLELVIGLVLFPLVFVSHGGSLLSKGFATRTLSEFGREPLLLVLNFQLNVGHPPALFHETPSHRMVIG
jgi:hypothetical protein